LKDTSIVSRKDSYIHSRLPPHPSRPPSPLLADPTLPNSPQTRTHASGDQRRHGVAEEDDPCDAALGLFVNVGHRGDGCECEGRGTDGGEGEDKVEHFVVGLVQGRGQSRKWGRRRRGRGRSSGGVTRREGEGKREREERR
jgi:hypothetical protein